MKTFYATLAEYPNWENAGGYLLWMWEEMPTGVQIHKALFKKGIADGSRFTLAHKLSIDGSAYHQGKVYKIRWAFSNVRPDMTLKWGSECNKPK